MSILEKSILSIISQGTTDVKSLTFTIEITESKLKRLLNNLINKKMITLEENDTVRLTINGLIKSTNVSNNKEYQIQYRGKDKNLFFTQKCNFNKDTMIIPHLSFDLKDNETEDGKYKIYETKLKFQTVNINILSVIENLLQNSFFETCGGFWIMNFDKEKICGHSVKNLILAKNKYPNEVGYFKIAYSENIYIIIIQGQMYQNNITNIKINIYLTNCAETPYVDVLSYLNKILKPFLNFVNIEQLYLGKEIYIKNYPIRKTVKSYNNPFLPIVKGKIYFKDIIQKTKLPLIIALDPINTNIPDLKNTSPWFVTCGGGFLEKDFKMKRKFTIGFVKGYELPTGLIFSAILFPHTPSKYNIS